MEDILSPTHAFLDFDFTELNFDVSNGPNTKSPSVLSSCSNSFSDFLSQSNYTHNEDLDHPLWSSIEELAFETTNGQPPTFTCIDEFIKDPTSDLVDLVQQSETERTLFQNLIMHTIGKITPDQMLCDQQFQQEPQRLLQQQHELNYFQQQFMYKQPPQPPPQHLDFQFHPLPISNSDHQKKQKNNTQVSKRSTKVSGYSTSSNSNYTNSDSVNAQLLRELIRQAGRNNRNATRMDSNSSVDMVNADFRLVPPKDPYYYAPMANGNYHTQPYQQYCTSASSIDLVGPPSLSPASSHSSRYHVPLSYNHISSNKKTVKQQKNHPYQRSSNSKSSNMGKPSMYSSDISQAQLLEIQAISRAQQDFIRAREQQEAEKEMMMKHQKKVAGQPLL